MEEDAINWCCRPLIDATVTAVLEDANTPDGEVEQGEMTCSPELSVSWTKDREAIKAASLTIEEETYIDSGLVDRPESWGIALFVGTDPLLLVLMRSVLTIVKYKYKIKK